MRRPHVGRELLAALCGVINRCRDLGVTLIAVNPLPTISGEKFMNTFHAEASYVIDARPEAIYNVLSDYRVGHQAILPRPVFQEMTVEQGGKGAGTVIRLRMQMYGQTFHYHHMISEPQPGRVLMETDLETGQYTTFTLEPLGNGQTRVTIASEFPIKPGLSGFIERLMQPSVVRRLYLQELRKLADYVRPN